MSSLDCILAKDTDYQEKNETDLGSDVTSQQHALAHVLISNYHKNLLSKLCSETPVPAIVCDQEFLKLVKILPPFIRMKKLE